MRLSDWRGEAPTREAIGQKVLAVIEPVLANLGCQSDPECWVAWGDDPGSRYSILVPTLRGLVQCHVRVNVPGEGPRSTGKLVRWPKVQIGEMMVEMVQGHRIVTTQLEGLVLRGVDESADRSAAFMMTVFDAIDGRILDGATTRARPRKPTTTRRSTKPASAARRRSPASTSPAAPSG
jgi:hypothetical protein